MPIIKNQILKGDYDTTRSVDVIPSGMTLTIKATLKNPNYDLVTTQDVLFTAPTANQQVRIYLVKATDPIEVVYDDAKPVNELVMDICSFTLTPTTTDLTKTDITVLEVV